MAVSFELPEYTAEVNALGTNGEVTSITLTSMGSGYTYANVRLEEGLVTAIPER